ncbi:unnamed protein product [Ixodes persulcatus]
MYALLKHVTFFSDVKTSSHPFLRKFQSWCQNATPNFWLQSCTLPRALFCFSWSPYVVSPSFLKPLSFIAVGRSPRYKVECFQRFRAYSYNSRKYHDCA